MIVARSAARVRRRAPCVVPLLLSAVLSVAPGCATRPPELRVTYIANEGFLLEAGPHKLIVDGLFQDPRIDFCDLPAEDLLARIEQGVPPFDEVDLVLVTHAHVDHFSAGVVSRFLAHHRRCRLVCPGQVRHALAEAQPDQAAIEGQIVVPAEGDPDLTVRGIRVKALRLRHAPFMVHDQETGTARDLHEQVEHLAYLIELSGRRILHLGDASVFKNSERLPGLIATLDIALVDGKDTSPESLQMLSARPGPKHVIYLHLPVQNRQKLIEFITARVRSRSYPPRPPAAHRRSGCSLWSQ